jgi:hypothetical protein
MLITGDYLRVRGWECSTFGAHLRPGKRRRGGSVKQARTPGQFTSWALIRVYDETGSVIETHEQASDFREFWQPTARG